MVAMWIALMVIQAMAASSMSGRMVPMFAVFPMGQFSFP